MWLDGCFHIGQRRPHDTIYSVQARPRRQAFEAIIAYSWRMGSVVLAEAVSAAGVAEVEVGGTGGTGPPAASAVRSVVWLRRREAKIV